MLARLAFVALMGFAIGALATSSALAISCGSTTNDTRFLAVCGLQRRSVPVDTAWKPEGSGVYIQWTDPQNIPRVGIITVQHFLDGNPNPSGNCDSQVNQWYAHFQGCPVPCPNCPSSPACVGDEANMIRVRVRCFRLAIAPYRELVASLPDGVVIGEIEPDDLCFLSHIEPIRLDTSYNLGLCIGQVVFIAGWGRTQTPPVIPGNDDPCRPIDPQFEARSLHVGVSTLRDTDCSLDGRAGQINFAVDVCSTTAAVQCHDSGGGLFVEVSGGQLRLIGVLFISGRAFMAQRHQLISSPNDETFLCRPCRPPACGDINGDAEHLQNCDDADCLEMMGERAVAPWCLGDLDGDGIAGTKTDLLIIRCDPDGPGTICDQNRWCWGDANLDGWVDGWDLELIRAVNGGGSVPCPLCGLCGGFSEWCRGDVNFDGVIDSADEDVVDGLDGILDDIMRTPYRCHIGAPGCPEPVNCQWPPP